MAVPRRVNMKNKKIRIGVIFGGRSGEHEVSYWSAVSVINAINKEKYEAIPIGITKAGKWISPKESWQALKSGKIEGESSTVLLNSSSSNPLVEISNNSGSNIFSVKNDIDVIFPVLHGPYGEDGTIQGMLELADIPYVGAGVASSAISMDKDLMKTIFKQKGLPILDWMTIKRKDWKEMPEKIIEKVNEKFDYPLYVKPTNLGSSVGITKVHGYGELKTAIDVASFYGRKILIEKGIEKASEIECSVLGNDDPRASVIGEVKPAGEFYDYTSKYIEKKTQLIIPAKLTERLSEKIQYMALEAFKAVDAAGMARVDFFVLKETGKIYLNEINTIPGFTVSSMYPRLWESSGLSYAALIDELIQLAIERYEDNKKNKTSYDSDI